MTPAQVATNAAATRWLAELLERWGLEDTDNRAEYVTRELLSQGLARAEVPPPLRSTRPPASDEARQRYLEEARAAIDARRSTR